MKMKNLLRVTLLLLSLAFFVSSCFEYESYAWEPYKGYVWSAEWGNDTVFLELLSGNNVTFYSKNGTMPRANGMYETHRKKFPFSDFSFESGAVKYNLHYATYDTNLYMVLYGDSINTERDSVPVEWNCGFVPLAK